MRPSSHCGPCGTMSPDLSAWSSVPLDVSLRLPDMATYVDDVDRGLRLDSVSSTTTRWATWRWQPSFCDRCWRRRQSARQAVEAFTRRSSLSAGPSQPSMALVLRKALSSPSKNRVEIALMRQMKLALDPKGILNPAGLTVSPRCLQRPLKIAAQKKGWLFPQPRLGLLQT